MDKGCSREVCLDVSRISAGGNQRLLRLDGMEYITFASVVSLVSSFYVDDYGYDIRYCGGEAVFPFVLFSSSPKLRSLQHP